MLSPSSHWSFFSFSSALPHLFRLVEQITCKQRHGFPSGPTAATQFKEITFLFSIKCWFPFLPTPTEFFFSSCAYSFLRMAHSFPFIKCKYKTNIFGKDLNTPSTLTSRSPDKKKTQTLLDYMCWHYPLPVSRIFPAPSCYSSAFLFSQLWALSFLLSCRQAVPSTAQTRHISQLCFSCTSRLYLIAH